MPTPEAHTVIIQPLFHTDNRRRPPVQLMQMGTIANEVVSTRVIDGQTLDLSTDNLAELTASLRPEIIGISMLSPTYPVSQDLAKAVKTLLPNSVVIAGGKHATLEPQVVLGTGDFDLLVRGEGDFALTNIIRQHLLSGGKVEKLQHTLAGQPGITFPGDENPLSLTPRVDLETLPSINWAILIPGLDSYLGNTASVEDQRGCVHDCSFCSASKYHRTVTFRNVNQITAEVKSLYDQGFTSYFLTGDDSFINPNRAFELLTSVNSSGLPIKMALNTRADSFMRCVKKYGQEFTGALAQVVTTLHIGVESGDEEILRQCNKKLHIEDVRQTIALAKKLNIAVETNWIIGLPDDSQTSIRNSLELALKLRDESGPHFPHVSYFLPYPGTLDAERAEKYGLFDPKKLDLAMLSAHDKPLISTRHLSTVIIRELFNEFITTFYSTAYIESLPSKDFKEKAILMKNKQLQIT